MRTDVIDWASAALTLPGQSESGDRHVIAPMDDGVLVAVVDGLGHGHEAAEASKRVASIIEGYTNGESLTSLVRRCHERLRGTRGAVMSLAVFNGGRTLTWMGIGNVEGRLLHKSAGAACAQETLLLRAGVVGERLPPLHPTRVPLIRHDVLIFATDGIDRNFTEGVAVDGGPQQIAEDIMARHGKRTDDALVLVARYVG